jgi:hypothetical protein
VQAPVLSQAVAPQVPPVVQAVVQQFPVPLIPQTPLAHWLLLVQA